MGYGSVAALIDRLGEPVFREIYPQKDFEFSSSPEMQFPGAAADLDSASAEINGAAAVRYRIPVTAAELQPLLADWCLVLASERAFLRAAGSACPEKIRQAAEQVRKHLELVRTGEFPLAGACENPARVAAYSRVSEPVFGRDKMRGF